MGRKEVVHIGPIDSKGGMSSVMNLLINNPPNKWNAKSIKTHSDENVFHKIIIWRKSLIELRRIIEDKEIHLAHIHVTHSMSWWRKLTYMRILRRRNVPIIIHIHSGKFDKFCNSFFGFVGLNIKKKMAYTNTKVIVLENRWKDMLNKWIPNDAQVINNPARTIESDTKRIIGEKIKILMLSRNSQGKGHKFAISVLDSLLKRGIDTELFMTGISNKTNIDLRGGKLKLLGWIEENEKQDLLDGGNFLIMPSEFEGASMSVIEAVMNNLPCIVSPASKETIGIEELVLSLDNPEDWAEKIIQLSDKKKYENILKKMVNVRKRYDIDNIKKQWEIIYNDIS